MPVTFNLEDKTTVAMWCWAISLKRDLLRSQGGSSSDISFLDNIIDLLHAGKTYQLEQEWSLADCATDDAACEEMNQDIDGASGDTPVREEVPCAAPVSKQSRKRDKKKKDDKRREYAKHSYSPGAPRTKGSTGYVLPARRSPEKKFFKKKVNRTVRRYKGYLPKGNGYRKMDPDLWMWW